MEFINDDTETVTNIDISNSADWMRFNSKEVAVDNDPFNIGESELKKVNGLSTNFRRKMSREFSKRFIGQDGTGTQQNLLQQAVTGYAMFDLVQPVYNLEYLSKIYEISPYNYAAINAKVANIVGLGYTFVETKKANDALDKIHFESNG